MAALVVLLIEAHGVAALSPDGQCIANLVLDAAFSPQPPTRGLDSPGMGTTNRHIRREGRR